MADGGGDARAPRALAGAGTDEPSGSLAMGGNKFCKVILVNVNCDSRALTFSEFVAGGGEGRGERETGSLAMGRAALGLSPAPGTHPSPLHLL